MNMFERLLSVFSGRRKALLGAMGQPNDLASYLYLIRAQAFQRITGKSLTHTRMPTSDAQNANDLKSNLGPSRRLLRREL
jgi:hypothetical protein